MLDLTRNRLHLLHRFLGDGHLPEIVGLHEKNERLRAALAGRNHHLPKLGGDVDAEQFLEIFTRVVTADQLLQNRLDAGGSAAHGKELFVFDGI